MRARRSLVYALAVVLVCGGVSAWRHSTRKTEVLARTVCPLRGLPRITVSASVAADDTAPVRVHEAVHAGQCRLLGPMRYAFRNFTSRGRLGLEVPAYCAAAEMRVARGQDAAGVWDRLRDDATEALRHVADSATVVAALRANCGTMFVVR